MKKSKLYLESSIHERINYKSNTFDRLCKWFNRYRAIPYWYSESTRDIINQKANWLKASRRHARKGKGYL